MMALKSNSKKVSILSPCYRGRPYLESFLENMAQQSMFGQYEIVLDHNEPTAKELSIVENFRRKYPRSITHCIVPKVTPIAQSINHCITNANGKYLCIGNIDDHRTPDSISSMCETLDRNPEVGFTYGDFIVVDKLGNRDGRKIEYQDFDKVAFMRGYLLGPFPMWRSDLTSKVGYWDEQFRACGDYDFAIRLALLSDGKKTRGNLGYYLNIGQGATSGGSHLPKNIQPVERTAIELRYGLYDKTMELNGYPYVQAARRYRRDQMLIHGQWQPVEKYIPGYRKMLEGREPIRRAFEKEYRRWLMKHYSDMPNRTRDVVKWGLTQMGLLEKVKDLKKALSWGA